MADGAGRGAKQAILYARVSGDEQVKKGYSLSDQRDTLRQWAEREGYEVLEEVADEGWSGAYLERPGWTGSANLWRLAASTSSRPSSGTGSPGAFTPSF